MNKIIEVQQLVKKYDNFTAVNAISFYVNEDLSNYMEVYNWLLSQ